MVQTHLRDHVWVLPAFALPQTLGAASFQPLTVEAFAVIIPAEQRHTCAQTSNPDTFRVKSQQIQHTDSRTTILLSD